MIFTSTTEIARKGSRAFSGIQYATVLHNNKDIGMIVGGELYERIKESHYFDDLLEDIEIEANKDVLQKQMQDSLESGLSDLVI